MADQPRADASLDPADSVDPDTAARACDLAVVSVEYRLAPDHPFPAAVDDCEAAAVWLVERGSAELGAEWLAIGGESAGAHLAALTLLRMQGRSGTAAFRAVVFTCGWFDLRLARSATAWGDRDLGLTTTDLRWLVDRFLDGVDAGDQAVSPLLGDLGGLPATLFTAGTLDPLLDDSLQMAERWRAAGNPAELAIYAGGVHSFTGYSFPLAEAANARVHAFLRGRLEEARA